MLMRRGQSTVEYAVLAAVVVGALLVMQIYMKRGVSGKLRESTDRVGEQFTPYSATHTLTTTLKGTRTDSTKDTGYIKSEVIAPETQTQSGTEEPVNKDMKDETLYGAHGN